MNIVKTVDVVNSAALDTLAGNIQIEEKNTEKHRVENDRYTKEMLKSGVLDEILNEIHTMTAKEMEELGLKRGDIVNTSPKATGKPVIITDMRNLRKMWKPSMVSAAEFLNVNPRRIYECCWGLRRQIDNYQVSYANVDDAVHVMSGIYKNYMDLI